MTLKRGVFLTNENKCTSDLFAKMHSRIRAIFANCFKILWKVTKYNSQYHQSQKKVGIVNDMTKNLVITAQK